MEKISLIGLLEEDFLELPGVKDILESHDIYPIHPVMVTWNETRYWIKADSREQIKAADKDLYETGLFDVTAGERILDSIFEIGFSDEYTECYSCGKLIRTAPDCYSWDPDFLMTDCEILCSDCYDDGVVIDLYLNDPDMALSKGMLKEPLESHGFRLFNDFEFENGWHPGQNDKPQDILKNLPDGLDYIFEISENSQFYIKFNLWVRK